ncbi:MAG TPA: hydrolase, partial [Haliscomenobacter sp.]|nr:hydrolase [Haliscomenobacter sp.]
YAFQYENVGKDYRAEVGYVPRTGYQFINAQAGYLFFPNSKVLINHGPLLMYNQYLNPASQQTEFTHVLMYRFNFQNTRQLTVWTARDYVKLLAPFDPTNFSGFNLATGTEHHWGSFGGDFTSKPQNIFTYTATFRYGGYFADGRRLRLGGDISYRLQPIAAIAMSVNYNRIEFDEAVVLPEQLKNSDWNFWLIGPRIDLTLTNKLFFTNFIQFNNQNKNVNLNLRVQWRYSPASDFFIVYTDNYYSEGLKIRNRALVAKLTYWWNG